MAFPTRRHFLNTSLGLATALSASAALAADVTKPAASQPATKPTKPKKKPKGADSLSGANGKINIAVIGCGDRGQYHISELLSLGDHVNIVAICDPDEARIAKQATHIEEETGNTTRTYTDVRKMLENKEIDAVTVATPNHWHTLASIWAVQAGKDVYVEKPLSHTVVEGRRLVEYARKYNKIVQHGTQSRSTKAMNQAMHFIHEGGLGKVYLARGTCYKRRPSCPTNRSRLR
jgi:predicted dehydrogenase